MFRIVMWLFSRWKLNIPSHPLRHSKPEQQRMCVCVWERKSKIFTEIRARKIFTLSTHYPRKRRTGASQDWWENRPRIDRASLTKPTCPLTKGDMKKTRDLTMVPRYIRDWLLARIVSESTSARVGVSVSLSRRIRAELAYELSANRKGTDSHSHYERPRITPRRSLTHDSFEILSICGRLSHSERKGLSS